MITIENPIKHCYGGNGDGRLFCLSSQHKTVISWNVSVSASGGRGGGDYGVGSVASISRSVQGHCSRKISQIYKILTINDHMCISQMY